jgi:cyclic beta-1,2-glucan synthetase
LNGTSARFIGSAAGILQAAAEADDGPFAGYPRVFGLAWAFVAHTDSRFDSLMLLRYLHAYQSVQPLTIGELWAVSVTLADRSHREPAAACRIHRANRRERADADSLQTVSWA